jgi:hypothetical protein
MNDEVAGPNDPPEEHKGVSTVPANLPCDEVKYTYEHVEEEPEPDAVLFRVVSFIRYTERPMHKNTYYVPTDALNGFLHESTEEIVDIRPISEESAQEEIDEYRDGEGDK